MGIGGQEYLSHLVFGSITVHCFDAVVFGGCTQWSASYARDGAKVTLRNMSLFDNVVARGSVLFAVDSYLWTHQVGKVAGESLCSTFRIIMYTMSNSVSNVWP